MSHVLILALLALVGMKCVWNVLVIWHEASRPPVSEVEGPQHGVPLIVVEPLLLLVAVALEAWVDGVVRGAIVLVVGAVLIASSYAAGIWIGHRVHRR